MKRARPTLPNALQGLAFALFALTLLLSINAVNLRVGPVPIRSLTLLFAGVLLYVPDGRLAREAAAKVKRLLYVILAVGTLGLIVSVIARAPIAGTVQQLIEIHVQAALGSFIACGLILRFGFKSLVLCFIGAFAVSALVAIGQALHLDLAWRLRAQIGILSHDPPLKEQGLVSRERALGLSFSPVLFASQSCLALAAVFYLRSSRTTWSSGPAFTFDWMIVGSAIMLAALCVVTGNRSPLIGFSVFLAVYVAIVAPRAAMALLPLMLIAALVTIPVLRQLSDAGLRVAKVDDSSSAGRATLRAFGLFLVGQRPIGYGLTFDSLNYWTYFAHQAGYMENPLSIRNWALHNYYIVILAKYGVLILAIPLLILPRNRYQAFLWLAFLPYAVHIFYHNDGPFQGDFMIFYILPAAMLVAQRWGLEATTMEKERRKQPWRRAFTAVRPQIT